MPVTTRAQAKGTNKPREPEPIKSKSSSNSNSNSKPVTKPKTTKIITNEHCEQFIRKPTINPLTGKSIKVNKPVYNELMNACINHLNEDATILKLLETDDDYAKKSCLWMIKHITPTSIKNPILQKEKRDYLLTSEIAQNMLKTCKDKHNIIFLDISFRKKKEPTYIPINIEYERGNIIISNYDDIHKLLTEYIINWGIYGTTKPAKFKKWIDNIIVGLEKVLDSNYLLYYQKREIEDLMIELKSMSFGFGIISEKSSTMSDSSINSLNRSRSKSIPKDLPPLSKKARKEILEELEETCIEMRDAISFDDFEDMKKKQLQLVIKIGPKTSENKQRCYYVKSIFDHYKNAIENSILPREPISKALITQTDLNELIMPMMRYIKPNVKTPGIITKKDYPNNELLITTVLHPTTNQEYYKIVLRRKIGLRIAKETLYGYIPAFIETGATDVNSDTVIAKVRELFDNGRLFRDGLRPSVHINKPLHYWDDDAVRKLILMMDELNSA